MEPGPPPLLTSAGILLLYNGANDKLVYGPGWILFDQAAQSRVGAPGDRANVIFLEGATARSGDPLDLTGYYGGTDQYTGAMRIRIKLP